MLQLHGTPVPSSALPRVPKDSSTLLSPLRSSSSSPHSSDRLRASHDHHMKFMSSMGSRRIFARNGGSGTVASVHQFQLEDTATTMDADESAMQSTVQDMEAAVAVILQEIGEDIERPVSHSCAFGDMCMTAVCFSQLLHFLCDGLEVSNFLLHHVQQLQQHWYAVCMWHNRFRPPSEPIALIYVHLCLVHCCISMTPSKLHHAIIFISIKLLAAGAARNTSALCAAPACINIWRQAAATA